MYGLPVAFTVWRMSPSTTASLPSTRIRGVDPAVSPGTWNSAIVRKWSAMSARVERGRIQGTAG
ncbi:hypothetical protein [Saccharopolyspora pogona]|uniref:hypothetical protein n=1 Tax=Saccharopolyspora pogona TaxID=333966 RepID=UPI001687C15D|nr:hypothetical protein [Saccharopolyspora pogona]